MKEYGKYNLRGPEKIAMAPLSLIKNANFFGSAYLRNILCYFLLPSREVICHTQLGKKMIVNPREDRYQQAIFSTGAYEPGTLALMGRVLKEGDTFLDIGANIGLMSLTAAHYVGARGRVYAFEPEPSNFKRLTQNISLNGADNVIPIQAALGSQEQTREVYAYPSVNIGRASLVRSVDAIPTGNTEVVTLSNFVRKNNISNIKMIKIDVEGFEFEVLVGAREYLSGDNQPTICVECDDEMPRETSGGSMAEIHELIMSTGKYNPHKFTRSKFHRGGEIEPFSQISEIGRHDNAIYLPK